jgi:uncharacterized protein YkwD
MKRSNIITVVLISAILSACGGGGSTTPPVAPKPPPVASNPNPPVAPPPTTPAVPEQDLQTSVPAPSYAANSEELAFFNAYNEFRAQAGLGKLAQNTKLDLAAKNHLNYQAQNLDLDLFSTDPATGRAVFHIESPSRPGFTGIQELDRAKFAQYAGSYVGETGSFGLGKGASQAFGDLLATVYHRAGFMFQSPRDIGIVVGADKNQTVIVEFGYETKRQFNASNYVGNYPADKQTGVRLVAVTELPNPFSDISLSEFATKTSYPVNVVTAEGTTLAVTSFTMTEAGQSTALDARLITKDNDPNKYVASNYAFLVGKAAFKPNTTYNVVFSGTVNGVALNKSWSFTTGS